jgi:hypothetical protein
VKVEIEFLFEYTFTAKHFIPRLKIENSSTSSLHKNKKGTETQQNNTQNNNSFNYLFSKVKK